MKARLRSVTSLLSSLLLAMAALTAPALAQDITLNHVNLLTNGGFEAEKPAYWDGAGAGAVWSSAEARTPGYSLALSGLGEASWTQEEAVRNWVARIIGNQEIVVGGWVRTDGVNTNPASDADKFQLVFEFFDASGADMLGGPVVIDVPQGAASSDGWVKIDNTSIGALTIPGDAPSARITFRKGANATGTAYLDDVFVTSTGPDWPGGWFNPNVDAGDTWYYWWDAFDIGKDDWPAAQPFFQTVTQEEAHTGSSSLKLVQNDPNASESVAISDRVPVTPGEPVLISFWVKTEGVLHPDSIGTADYNIGLTALWYSSMESGSAGYNELGGLDIRLNGDYNPNVIPLVPREEETGWTQYAFVVYPRADAVGMELRLRYWHHFEGTTYWDDIAIANIGGTVLTGTAIEEDDVAGELPEKFNLHQNYPNPFNPATSISFDLASMGLVNLDVYNLLGQRVATLVDGREMAAGTHSVRFDAANLSSGTYLYVLKTAHHVETRTMVLIK
ncbi:MAG: T9SS type A sorting domain-containing protein [Rhodothermales bacterium]